MQIVTLRAHHFLCAQGFRGLGYSRAFAENFAAVLEALRQRPETVVEAIDRADVLCGACPHLADDRCRRGGVEAESKAGDLDRRVLDRLGLPSGARLSWGEWLRQIGGSIAPTDLADLCGACPWLPLDHCVTGLARLRQGL